MADRPGAGPGAPALARLVGDPDRFVAEVWGCAPLRHRDRAGFADLMTLADVDHLVTSTALRTPLFRLVRDGETLPVSGYTKTGRTGSSSMTGLADGAAVARHFSEGATIVLQGMHRYWPPVTRLCGELESALGHPTQVNAYITPPGARGLAVHRDAHDVFVLQAFGSKHWEVYERPPGRPAAGASKEPGEPVLSVALEPGDCLYLPKGTPHAARAQETLSGHLTVGVPALTWGALLRRSVERLTEGVHDDEPLPAAYHRDPAAFAGALRERLEELRRRLGEVDPAAAAHERVRSFFTTRPARLQGHLADVARLDGLGDDSPVRRRPGAICELLPGPERLLVLLGDRELRVPARLEAAVREIAARPGAFAPRDLAPHLGDAESRLVLVRRLVREGLLEVVGDD